MTYHIYSQNIEVPVERKPRFVLVFSDNEETEIFSVIKGIFFNILTSFYQFEIPLAFLRILIQFQKKFYIIQY